MCRVDIPNRDCGVCVDWFAPFRVENGVNLFLLIPCLVLSDLFQRDFCCIFRMLLKWKTVSSENSTWTQCQNFRYIWPTLSYIGKSPQFIMLFTNLKKKKSTFFFQYTAMFTWRSLGRPLYLPLAIAKVIPHMMFLPLICTREISKYHLFLRISFIL